MGMSEHGESYGRGVYSQTAEVAFWILRTANSNRSAY